MEEETEIQDETETVEKTTSAGGTITKKMLIISSLICGAMAVLLWGILGFPQKLLNPDKKENIIGWAWKILK